MQKCKTKSQISKKYKPMKRKKISKQTSAT